MDEGLFLRRFSYSPFNNRCDFYFQDNQLLDITTSKYRSVLNEQSVSSSTFSPSLVFDAVLYVNNVTKSDHGIYQCKVENTLGQDISDITLSGLSE